MNTKNSSCHLEVRMYDCQRYQKHRRACEQPYPFLCEPNSLEEEAVVARKGALLRFSAHVSSEGVNAPPFLK